MQRPAAAGKCQQQSKTAIRGVNMIAKLTGILEESELTQVRLDVHGVGYAVSIPLSTYEKLPAAGKEVSLHTYLAVREDAMQLYGFATKEERTLFLLLMNAVSGVGAKTALSVLSSVNLQDFAKAVAAGDAKGLSKINGIGKKTAERIIVELKDKLPEFLTSMKGPEGVGAGIAGASHGLPPQGADAVAALETLGFKRDAAEKMVQTLLGEVQEGIPSSEQLIRQALARFRK